jgi:putative two-component system response regulator
MQQTATFTKKIPSILIVDDIETNLELLETIFHKAGFKVHKALNGERAIEIFKKDSIDIAILDVMMPGIDGFQLCSMLKSMAGKRYIPIILLTALSDKKSRITGLECGADDFISKPFDSTELITKIMSLLKLKSLYDELEHSENIILTLAIALEARDPYTKGHSSRVSELAVRFASYLMIPKEEQEIIRKAGLLHDIGKIGINENILHKKGRLTPAEMEEVKRHVLIGEEICRPLNSMRDVIPIIRYHHERWDGRGFPDGLSGKDIPFSARLLAIIDAYDAMVSARPYREGLHPLRVLGCMKEERYSGQWDPELLGEFLSIMPAITRSQT